MEEVNFLKITNAAYKILDCLPDSDPLKNRAKDKALAILENSTLLNQAQGWVSLKSLLSSESQKISLELLRDIEVLESYLDIGKSQGWISAMNFLIISKEYEAIKSSIGPLKFTSLYGQLPNSSRKETVVGKDAHGSGKSTMVEKPKKSEVKDMAVQEYSIRQKKILEILEDKEKAQVSDIIKELPDVTKRTIRRDLDDLLKKQKIVRVGEWNQVFYQKSP